VIALPAAVWGGGRWYRLVVSGVPTGLFLGVLAWLDSGFALAFVVVSLVMGVGAGVWMVRRMNRYWPGSFAFSGPDRVELVRAARRGEPVFNASLAVGVADYAAGLRAAADAADIRWRWVIAMVLAAAAGCAIYDARYGSWGNLAVSVIYLALLVFELFCWGRVRDRLVANAARSALLSVGS